MVIGDFLCSAMTASCAKSEHSLAVLRKKFFRVYEGASIHYRDTVSESTDLLSIFGKNFWLLGFGNWHLICSLCRVAYFSFWAFDGAVLVIPMIILTCA